MTNSKTILAILAATILAGCSGTPPAGPMAPVSDDARIGVGDLADAGTTAIGLASGFAEANPAVAFAGPATPLLLIGGKYVLKEVMIAEGMDPYIANTTVESVGMGAACANIAIMAAAAGPAAAVAAVGCGIAYAAYQNEQRDAAVLSAQNAGADK
jgi:hypothetical protein